MARILEDYRTLTGQQKAAILMLAIGEQHSSKMFAIMDDEEIKELSQVMANLGSVNANLVERLFIEFADQLASTGSLVGSFESTERLLMKGLPKERVEPSPFAVRTSLAHMNEHQRALGLEQVAVHLLAVAGIDGEVAQVVLDLECHP